MPTAAQPQEGKETKLTTTGLNKCTRTNVKEQLNLGKLAFFFKGCFVGFFYFFLGFVGFFFFFFSPIFFCYPIYAALVDSQWAPSFKHNVLNRLILQESRNRQRCFAVNTLQR